jgi:uncharacterized protein YndB with AHSA1/START domain
MTKKSGSTTKEVRGPVGFSTEAWVKSPKARVWQLATKGAWLNRYFTSAATGDLDAPGTVRLSWGKESEEVEVLSAAWERRVVFLWAAYGVKYATRVAMTFEEKNGMTRVGLRETGWRRDGKGVNSALHHAEGWTFFLCALKAYARWGVDLRG